MLASARMPEEEIKRSLEKNNKACEPPAGKCNGNQEIKESGSEE